MARPRSPRNTALPRRSQEPSDPRSSSSRGEKTALPSSSIRRCSRRSLASRPSDRWRDSRARRRTSHLRTPGGLVSTGCRIARSEVGRSGHPSTRAHIFSVPPGRCIGRRRRSGWGRRAMNIARSGRRCFRGRHRTRFRSMSRPRCRRSRPRDTPFRPHRQRRSRHSCRGLTGDHCTLRPVLTDRSFRSRPGTYRSQMCRSGYRGRTRRSCRSWTDHRARRRRCLRTMFLRWDTRRSHRCNLDPPSTRCYRIRSDRRCPTDPRRGRCRGRGRCPRICRRRVRRSDLVRRYFRTHRSVRGWCPS